MKKLCLPAIAGLLVSQQVFAIVPVTVDSSIPITVEVMPALVGLQATMVEILTTETEIGTAVVQASDKQATIIGEAGRAQREADIFGRQTERLEQARIQYTVADSICSEAASGVAATVGKVSRAGASQLAAGQGITNPVVSRTFESLPVSEEQGNYRSAAMHASYCSAAEYAQYGGTDLCPQVSKQPGGDTEVRSLVDGAGEVGKEPDLTFTEEQIAAAIAYIKNSVRHDTARTPGKGEIQSASGRQYQGLMTQYKAAQSAAAQPQVDMVAASKPNEATRDVLTEVLESKSAAAYFRATASDEAKKAGLMSEREYEAFEVGRRYANTDYEADLQGMEGDNLMRELIRVQSLSNWLQLGIKNDGRQANVLAGQNLALAADQKYGPQLQRLEDKMSAGVSGNAK